MIPGVNEDEYIKRIRLQEKNKKTNKYEQKNKQSIKNCKYELNKDQRNRKRITNY